MIALSEIEAAVLARLEAIGNPLGWKPAGRDENGYARLRADLPGLHCTRRVVMTITPKGNIQQERLIPR